MTEDNYLTNILGAIVDALEDNYVHGERQAAIVAHVIGAMELEDAAWNAPIAPFEDRSWVVYGIEIAAANRARRERAARRAVTPKDGDAVKAATK